MVIQIAVITMELVLLDRVGGVAFSPVQEIMEIG
jgi:hypothetical protein